MVAVKALEIVSTISTSVNRLAWQVVGPSRQWQPEVNSESRSERISHLNQLFNLWFSLSRCQVDICRQPVVIGRCNGYASQERRWYYDDERGTCVSFIYSGCSGNQNNFRSFEACTNQCGSKTVVTLPPPATRHSTP